MRQWLLLCLAASVSPAWSFCIEENKPLPAVTLNAVTAGQIVYHQDKQELQYQPWSTSSLTGKIFVVYHLAARHGIDEVNNPFIEALNHLPENSYQLVVMLNIDDVFTGGKYFARRTFENNAKESGNHVMFVLDDHSALREHWCIREKSSTVIVIGPDGAVLQAKDGALTAGEIQDYLQTIEQAAHQ